MGYALAMSDIFSVLADPTRRALLAALAAESRTVSQLVALTGDGQPTISKHLKTLRDAGLVSVAAAGQARVYSIDRGPLAEISAFLNEIAPGISGSGAGASEPSTSASTQDSTKPTPGNEVEQTLTDAAVLLAGWINQGAAWVGAKVQQTVEENDLSVGRLGKDLGRKLADAKLQATDAAIDAEAQIRHDLAELSARLGVQAADLRIALDAAIEDGKIIAGEKIAEVREGAADKFAEAKDAVLGRRKAAYENAATAESETDSEF